MNSALMYIGFGSCISGPLIAYFDRYSDVHTHSIVVVIFIVCEVLYVFMFIQLLNDNRTKFPNKNSPIDTLLNLRYLTCVLGGIMLGCKVLGIKNGGFGAIGELIVFEVSFGMYAILACVSPYQDVLVVSQE